jgi:hypothetical protein
MKTTKLNPFIKPELWAAALGKAPRTLMARRVPAHRDTNPNTTRLPGHLKVDPPLDKNAAIFADRGSYDPAFAAWADKLLEDELANNGEMKLGSNDDDWDNATHGGNDQVQEGDLAALARSDPETAALLAILGGGQGQDELAIGAVMAQIMGVGPDGDLAAGDLLGLLGGMGGMPRLESSMPTAVRIDADFSQLPLLPFHDDQFIDFLATLPNDLFDLFVQQMIDCWNSFRGVFRNIDAAGRWHEVEERSGVSRATVDQMQTKIMRRYFLWQQAYQEGKGNVDGARDQMLEALADMRYLLPMRTAFLDEVRTTPVLASPIGAVKAVAVSDIGKRPGHVFIAMDNIGNYPKRLSSIARLEFIRAQLREFPQTPVVLSIDADQVSYILGLLKRHLEPEQLKLISFIVRPFPNPKIKSDPRTSWGRDGFLLFEEADGKLVLKAPEVYLQLAPHVFRAFGELIGARPERLPLKKFEGGNHLVGEDVVLVGNNELAKNLDFVAYDPAALEQAARKYATEMGKDVLFMGDPIIGQALHHDDLYTTMLPDGQLMVTDYRRGLDQLLDLTDADWDSLIRQHRENVERWVPELSEQEEEFDLFESLAARIRPASRDEAFMQVLETWTEGMSATIDREIKLIEATGRQVKRMPGYLIPGVGGGMGYANVVIEQEDDSNVMFVPGYGSELDEEAVKSFRDAGYQGRVVLVPGMISSALLCGGTNRCVSFVAPESGQSQDSHPWMFDHERLSKLFRVVDAEAPRVSASRNQQVFSQFSRNTREFFAQALQDDVQNRVNDESIAAHLAQREAQRLAELVLHAHYLALRHTDLNPRHDLIDSRDYWQAIVRFVRANEGFASDQNARREIVLSTIGFMQSKSAENQFRAEFVANLFDSTSDVQISVNQGISIFTVRKDGIEWIAAFPPENEIWFSATSLSGDRQVGTFERHVDRAMRKINEDREGLFVGDKAKIAFTPRFRGAFEREFSRRLNDEPFHE